MMSAVFSTFQRHIVFPGPEGVTAALLHQVATQVEATELRIPTADGETLYGWHRAAVRSGFPRRLVLYFHGNASSLLAQLELQSLLLHDGWDFLGIHYRGYPGSTGIPSEAGVREDALAAWRWATSELETLAARIAIHGRSLGGGVAAQLAAETKPGALVLESTFSSIVDLAKERFPWLPVTMVLEYRFMTRALPERVSCPVLVAHGSGDSLIDVHHGRELARLFDARDYIEVPRIDHNEPLLVGAAASRYLRFLDMVVLKTPE